jgi:hypothetical protein
MSSDHSQEKTHCGPSQNDSGLKRRDLLLSGTSVLAASALSTTGLTSPAQAQQQAPAPAHGQGSGPISCSSWATTSAGSTSAPTTGA